MLHGNEKEQKQKQNWKVTFGEEKLSSFNLARLDCYDNYSSSYTTTATTSTRDEIFYAIMM